jgi:hypothetical protein
MSTVLAKGSQQGVATPLMLAQRAFRSKHATYEKTLDRQFSYPVGAMSRRQWIEHCINTDIRIGKDQDDNTGYFDGERWLFSATKAEQVYFHFLQDRL